MTLWTLQKVPLVRCYYIARQRDANKSTEGLKWISVLSYEREREWELGCVDNRPSADSSDLKDNGCPKKNYFPTWFQVSATEYEIFALLGCYSAFICSYRRFGKHRYDFQGSVQETCFDFLTVGRWNRYVVPKRRWLTTNQICVPSQTSEDLISI